VVTQISSFQRIFHFGIGFSDKKTLKDSDNKLVNKTDEYLSRRLTNAVAGNCQVIPIIPVNLAINLKD
jgi:hypothetical protein